MYLINASQGSRTNAQVSSNHLQSMGNKQIELYTTSAGLKKKQKKLGGNNCTSKHFSTISFSYTHPAVNFPHHL